MTACSFDSFACGSGVQLPVMEKMAMSLLAALLLVGLAGNVVKASDASVNIFNGLPQELKVHCKSRDDDLHKQVLAPGQKYGWGFHENYLGNTLFYCFFWTGTGGIVEWSQAFDVWTDGGFWEEKEQPCIQCEWYVRPSGFYRADYYTHTNPGPEKVGNWEKGVCAKCK